MSDTERVPVKHLELGLGELGKYDDSGEVRVHVRTSSIENLGEWALQEGFSETEKDENLNAIARKLRQIRRIRREQRSRE